MSTKDSNDNTSVMKLFRTRSEPWKPLPEELREKEPKPDIKHCRCCTCRDLGKVSKK